jgi:hypothetical protein
MNPVQDYMLNVLKVGTPEASQSLALKVQPMDVVNIVNGVIQTDLPHQPNYYSTGSYFDPQT